jgi:hypothetical protein
MTADTSSRERARSIGRRVALSVVVSSLALPTVTVLDAGRTAALSSGPGEAAAPTIAPLAAAETAATITFDGAVFVPAVTRVGPEATLRFDNVGADVLAVQIEPGGFRVSPIPAGGAGVTMLGLGSYQVTDLTTGATARVLVGPSDLGAPPTDPIEDHIPDAWFEPEHPSNHSYDPVTGVTASISRLRLRFQPGTTVGEAEAVLERAGAAIGGGFPSIGLLGIEIAGTADHSAARAAVAQLRSEPSVLHVGRMTIDEPDALPPSSDLDHWRWRNSFAAGGGNWGLEASRFPQAWNLADHAAGASASITTLVIDGGFYDGHVDLPPGTFEIGQICFDSLVLFGSNCTNPAIVSDHGNHVAGTIGAAHNFTTDPVRGIGVDGANPFASMIGVSKSGFTGIDLLQRALDLKAAGDPTFADLRVVNFSMSDLFHWSTASEWAAARRELDCGFGATDDDTVDGAPCLPWTDDDFLAMVAEEAAAAMPTLELASQLGVVVVPASANPAAIFCVFEGKLYATQDEKDSCTPLTDPGQPGVGRPSNRVASRFNAASDDWPANATEANPVIPVDAIGPEDGGTFPRAEFSNVGGAVSAPGVDVWSSTEVVDGESTWGFESGTSMAAPHVSGLVGYMLALDPGLDVAGIRAAIATFGDVSGASPDLTPAPRIDAFGSVMRIDGMLEVLLDVNDPSPDGNRRVIRGPGGGTVALDTTMSTTPGFAAEPDGVIDIRDFRRFRDAWLESCGIVVGSRCEAAHAAGVFLDGGDDHPKRDYNLDLCVYGTPGVFCPTPEDVASRLDFNGDGFPATGSRDPVEIDGASQLLSDLGVMATRFTPAENGEGWYAPPGDVEQIEDLLEELLVSADVEVRFEGLLAVGASDFFVELRDGGATTWVRPLPEADDAMVVTVPAGRQVDVVVQATLDGNPIEYGQTFELRAGEDVRYDPCNVIRVFTEAGSVAMGGTMNVSSELDSCDDVDLSGVTVDFEVTRNGLLTDTVMNPQVVVTGASGTAASVLEAGTRPGTYVITASAELPVLGGTIPVNGSATIEVETGYALTSLSGTAHGYHGAQPSIAADGVVTFTARTVQPSADDPSPPYDQIWRSDSTGLTEIAQRARDLVPAGTSFGPRVDAKADDWAFVRGAHDNEAENDADREFREYALRLVGLSGGSAIAAVYATSRSGFLNSDPLIDVGIPVRNAAGQELVPVQQSTDITSRLARYSFGQLAPGPMLGIDWPRLADDGTSVGTGIHFPVPTNSGGTFVTSAVVAGELAMGTSTAAAVTPLAVVNAPNAATPTPWTLVGNKPDISASGDVVAFVADRGAGPSTYLSVRVGGNFTAPVAISGPDRAGPPEVDLPTGRQNLIIETDRDEHDLNVGVIHHAAGDEGLAGDQVIVAVFGHPELQPDRGGLFTIPVTLSADGSANPGDARSVMELGDLVDGSPVELIGWHRALNSDTFTTEPDEHQLAFFVRTAAREHIVQANWIAHEEAGVSPLASPARLAEPATLPTPSAPSTGAHGLSSVPQAAFPGTGDPWTLPVLIVSDVTPTAGDTIVATNRSSVDGEPAYARIDYDGNPEFPINDLGQEVLIAPPAGPFTVTLTTLAGRTVSLTFDVAGSPSVPPNADAGGPYTIETGDDLLLDASASTDADGSVAGFAWDLDGDGEYDDARGATPRVPWASVVDLFCGGQCDSDGTYPISVEVTDDEAATATAATTVRMDFVFQDFSLALFPASQPANPGRNHVYRVEVGTVGGFTGDVTLTVDPLPDGYRATLSRARVAAPASVDLNVFVPSDAVEGAVPIVVRGVSGTVEHDTTGSADVSFGLIPICYEPVSGIVVDALTGAPLAGRQVRLLPGSGSYKYATTGADGRFEFADIQVVSGFLRVAALGDAQYFEVEEFLRHRCGDPIDAVLGLVEREYVAAQGQVVVGVPDPADTSRHRAVVATSTPLAGATVRVGVFEGAPTPFGPTTADGNYLIDDVPLRSPDNADSRGYISAQAPEHWPYETGFLTFTSGPPTTLDVPLVPACTVKAGVRGRVTDSDGNPWEGRGVRLQGSSGPPTATSSLVGTATTDADGYYEIPLGDSYLGINNSAWGFSVHDAKFSSTVRGSFTIDRCGAEVMGAVDYIIDINPPPPPRVRNLTKVTGRIIDGVTGQPLRLTARLWSGTGRIETDDHPGADGRFELNVLVGYDDETLRTGLNVSALESISRGYRGATVGPITVSSDEPYDVGDILVYPIHWAGLRGRVFDVATGTPLANAHVGISLSQLGGDETNATVTDADGYYEWNFLATPLEDKPFTVRVSSSRFNADHGDKYWTETFDVDLVPDETSVQDFALLRVCENVTLRGIVIDAVTREPIEGARIIAGNYTAEFTDENGFFLFEQLRSGMKNTPTTLRLTASATGYVTQTRYVSVFCGATIDVSFGIETGSGSVFGTVTDETGAPIPDAFVGSGAGGSDTAAADGTYRIDDVPLGIDGGPTEWDFTASHPDGRQITLPATVTDGGETELNFVFPIKLNTPPVARDVDVTVEAGFSVAVTLDGFDADGDALTYDLVSTPAVGALSGTAPDLTYDAPSGFEGPVTFTYTTSDAEATSAPATVTITVEPPNNPPTADDINVAVVEGETVSITLTGDDPDADPIGFRITRYPDVGYLTGTAPDLTYHAPADGGGLVTSFIYVSDDGEDTSAPATVTITIEEPPPNNPPTVDDISTSVVAGESVAITLTGSDLDGDPLTFEIATGPAIGSVVGIPPNVNYLAPADAGGQVATFTYTATDGEDTSAAATVTITIEEPPPNTPPEAEDINTTVEAGHSINIRLRGYDADDDAITYAIVSGPTAGNLSGTPPNMVYNAPDDGTTQATFTYKTNDGTDDSRVATVSITILPPREFGAVFGTVTDDLGNPLQGAEVFSEAAFGGFAITAPDGSYFIGDVPVGTSRFFAFSPDWREMARSATVAAGELTELNFVFPTDGSPTNLPPTADDIAVSVAPGESVDITLTGSDPDGNLLVFHIVEGPPIGFLSGVEPDVMYHAPPGFDTVVTFRYIAEDGLVGSDPATVTITIEDSAPNTPPVADDINVSVTAGDTVGITLTGTDTDGDPLTFNITTPPDLGTLTGTEPDLTYQAPADAGGQQTTFTYTATDGTDTSQPATVTITIDEPPDEPPVIDAIDDVTMDEGAVRSIAVAASDPDGDAVTLRMTGGPPWAAFSDLDGGAGAVGLTPADDDLRTITIEACAGGLCTERSFTVTVRNVDPTLLIDAPASTPVDTTVSISGIVSDPGADEWTYQIDCGNGYSQTQSSPEFECSFDTAGPMQIDMRVFDDDGGEGTASATIDVTPRPELSVTASNDGPAPWGTDVLLAASAESSGLTQPITYRWDVDGDGVYDTAPSADPTTVTQYAAPGERTATVEACSGALCATGTTDVVITKRPSTMSPPDGGPVQHSDATTISTTLVDATDGAPLPGHSTVVTVAGGPNPLLTDASGTALLVWTAEVAAGTVALTASFAGDELYEPSAASGSLEVVLEDARLEWAARPAAPAATYDVHVVVREAPDGALGDLAFTAVTFWVDEGCDGAPVAAGSFPVVDSDGDGAGDVIATIPGLASQGCVRAELTAPDGAPSDRYIAAPIVASVVEEADGFVTGGGRYDTADGWVSVGFVARRENGVLSGHVEIVYHGQGTVQQRSIELTGLTIVEDPDGGYTATITAKFLQRTDAGWVETEVTFVVHDGGKGRSADWASCDRCPPPIEGTFRGQVVVHRKRRR